MAELERIYKDTDTGGWGWVTQESTGGGAPGAISDVLFYSLTTPFTLDAANSWTYKMVPADFGAVKYQRGSDITLEAAGNGKAIFKSAAGGDFGLNLYINCFLTADSGSSDPRFCEAFVVQSEDTSIGLDATFLLADGQDVTFTFESQPFFEVPAGGTICGNGIGAFMVNATGTDSILVSPILSIWKMGPLP